ncbi:TonB-dependent receptor domain-containing protein [Thalassotalea piscium]|uniref:Outer membrane receptor protein involved in Fe transport n=1 Tax=Thalassotalea piscium TaxID=1230533 RepID=A0A7X0NIY3_9GAMM|nr:TonB-dependent receptor [Thalassotalea piscium]MBB6544265.1 outer membrane receptor protein involved in Fe transport [Thalassotalea piscium]
MSIKNNCKSSSSRKTLIALAIGAAVSSGHVYAQENDNEVQNTEIEKIEVTGSRLTRTTFDAPSPTTVISAQSIQMTGALNMNDVLSTMPQFGKGFDATDGNYSFGNSGINAPDLRDLGPTRTLNLVNGKRPISITNDSNIMLTDIGIIPSELIERVEVLTGGGSAVYGSDAVAGVVNFILKKDFEGTAIRSQVGGTDAGGASSRSLTVTHGLNFDDGRGNFSMSVDYFEQEALYYKDRPGSANTKRFIPNPANTGPNDGIPDQIIATDLTYPNFGADKNVFGVWNTATGGADWYQLDDGVASLRTPNTSVVDGWLATDGSGFDPVEWGMARNPYDRTNAYARFGYIFDEVTMAIDVMYSKTKSQDEIDPPFVWDTWTTVETLTADGITVPDSVQDTLNAYGDNWLLLPYTFDEAGGRGHKNEREYFSTSLTLEGDINDNWSWDVYVTTGFTKAKLNSDNALRNDRFNSGNFTLIGPCQEQGNCPSFSPFEPASQDVLDYVMASHETTTDVKGHGFAANISGDVYELPAGRIQVSAGAELRYESLDYRPSELWSSGKLSSQMTGIDDVSRNIKEVYGEFLIPVVADAAFAKSIEVEGAVRYAKYSTESASFTSSKLGVNWAINDDLRFRTTYSRAVRAPQLGEMFSGLSIGYSDLTDPCDSDQIDGGPSDGRRKANCKSLGITDGWDSNLKGKRGKIISSGNTQLSEETATTLTAGFVFQPTYLDNLRVSIDYYDIDLADLIVSFGASSVLSNCVDLESINNEYCAQIERDSNGDVLSVRDTFLNADNSRRRGVDVEADYAIDMAKSFDLPGTFTLAMGVTRQLEKSYTEYDFVEGKPLKSDALGSLGAPKWKTDVMATYNLDELSVRWTTKFTQGGPRYNDLNPDRYENQEIEDSIVHNLWVGYDLTPTANIYVGVNNVTDETWLDNPFTNWGALNYSLLGRAFYAGVNYSF